MSSIIALASTSQLTAPNRSHPLRPLNEYIRTKRHALGLLVRTLSHTLTKQVIPNGAKATRLLAQTATKIKDTIMHPVWHSSKAGFRSLQKTLSSMCKLCKTRKQPLLPGTNKKGYEFLGTHKGPFIKGAVRTAQAIKRWKWKKFMVEMGAHTSISVAINSIVKATQKGTGAAIRAAKTVMTNPAQVIKQMLSTAHMSWQKLTQTDPVVTSGCMVAVGALVLSTSYRDITDNNNHTNNPTFERLKQLSDDILYVAQSDHDQETKVAKIEQLRKQIANELLVGTQDEQLLLEFDIATEKMGEDVILEQLQRWDTVLAYKNAPGNTKTIIEVKNEALQDENLDWTVFPLMEQYRNATIYDKLYITSKLSKEKLEAQDRLILRTAQYVKDQILFSWDLVHRDIFFEQPAKNSTWVEAHRNMVPSHGECAASPIGRTENTTRCQQECEEHNMKACNKHYKNNSPCTTRPCNAITVHPNIALNKPINCTLLNCPDGTIRMRDELGSSLRTVHTPGHKYMNMQTLVQGPTHSTSTWLQWLEDHKTEAFSYATGLLALISLTIACCCTAYIIKRPRQPRRLLDEETSRLEAPIIKQHQNKVPRTASDQLPPPPNPPTPPNHTYDTPLLHTNTTLYQ